MVDEPFNDSEFVINASQIGSLIGVFGTDKQHRAILDVWRKSRFNHLLVETQRQHEDIYNNQLDWNKLRQCLDRLGMYAEYDKHKANVFGCKHVSIGITKCIWILFGKDDPKTNLLQFFNSIIENSDIGPISDLLMIDVLECVNLLQCKTFEDTDFHNEYSVLTKHQNELKFLGLPQYIPLLSKLRALAWYRTCLFRAHGKTQEPLLIKHYNDTHKVPITRDGKFYFSVIGETEKKGYTFAIQGKIDGFIDSEKYKVIVEIKTRTSVFTPMINDSDYCQLMAYMYMTGTKNGKLLEFLNFDKTCMKQTDVTFTNEDWQTRVVSKLSAVMSLLEQLIIDPMMRDMYFELSSISRKKYVFDKLFK